MGTLAHDIPDVPRPLTWLWEFLKHELAPYPGRAVTVARMVLAATLVMIICNTFRIPYAFLGGIYALLISRESPRATLSSAGTILLLAATGVAYILVSVQFVISVPLLHFLWNIGSLFLAFYALTVVTNYGAFVGFALVISIAVTIWDRHVSAGTNVADTLWLSLVAFIAVVVTSGVELAFRRMRPGDDIVVPVADRLAAIHSVLICYSEGRSVDQATEEKVIRLGMLGTSTLRRALRRSDYSPQYRAQMSGVVALVGRLVDITTALTQLSFEPSSIDQEHLRNLAAAVASIRSDLMYRRIPGSIQVNTEDEPHRVPLLREMENTVALIPQAFAGSRSIDEYQAPSEEMPRSKLIAADAFVNPEHFRFALKGCFAVSACYVIYNSIDWPGMGVPVMLTCFLTAVSTIGTSRQRQILRFAGFVVGGLLIGMSAPGVHSAVPRFDCGIHGSFHTRHSAGRVVHDVQPSIVILRAATWCGVLRDQHKSEVREGDVALRGEGPRCRGLPGAADDVVDIRSTLERSGECRDEESVYFHFASVSSVRTGTSFS